MKARISKQEFKEDKNINSNKMITYMKIHYYY